jgi:tRNA (adenine37-N6)-methyltransferase
MQAPEAGTVPLPVIGVVRTGHPDPAGTPIQAGLNRAERGTLEIAEPYRDGLDGLQGFSHAWLLSWLHRPGEMAGRPGVEARRPGVEARRPDEAGRSEEPGRGGEPAMRQVPFLLRGQGREVGVFATRTPRRINPIGLSLIELLAVTGGTVLFAGVDLVDGTPVIDLKPYVTCFDRPPGEPRCGWYDEVAMPEGSTPVRLAGPEPPG